MVLLDWTMLDQLRTQSRWKTKAGTFRTRGCPSCLLPHSRRKSCNWSIPCDTALQGMCGFSCAIWGKYKALESRTWLPRRNPVVEICCYYSNHSFYICSIHGSLLHYSIENFTISYLVGVLRALIQFFNFGIPFLLYRFRASMFVWMCRRMVMHIYKE